ncbi:carboxypeptidase-like regulatory domain-containing protein [uncultured Muribaculum sp.]|uniref:carboxypeptidase-like regulatory domain-containing protein n=1 Tax=uncultured Muribaculum sp. TaxID=1918613 RepID=UPI0027298537|nr:carboxypeptidase-like regulatory domain-containing protein [uncultured Muribaculum sp.]
MARGKQTCKILKEIRRQIAEANGIEFATSECRYKGDCLGTCPKCEAEVRYLEQQLRARSIAGKAVALAGISAASLAILMPISTEAKTSTDIKIAPADNITATRVDSVKVKGFVRYEFEAKVDSIASEELIGATVLNLTNGKGTSTDIDGKFEIDAQEGDSIQVSFVGYKSKTTVVTDVRKPITVTLDMKTMLLGEIPIVKREENHYLNLIVSDEYGNLMERDKLDISRIWIEEDGEEDYELSPEYFDEKHPCRIYWDYDYGLQDEDGKPLKEATLRIEAEGYDDPVIISVKYPKRNAKKTIKFKHKKK